MDDFALLSRANVVAACGDNDRTRRQLIKYELYTETGYMRVSRTHWGFRV